MYRCNAGYATGDGTPLEVTCLENMSWSVSSKSCTRAYLCSSPVWADCMSDFDVLKMFFALKFGSYPALGLQTHLEFSC